MYFIYLRFKHVNPTTMKKKLILVFAIALFAIVNTQCTEFKYRINHKGKIIEVSVNAWKAHEAHGDYIITTIYKMEDGSLEEF